MFGMRLRRSAVIHPAKDRAVLRGRWVVWHLAVSETLRALLGGIAARVGCGSRRYILAHVASVALVQS
jgi:hypothetical protein